MNKMKDDFHVVLRLTMRNSKIFLKDKANVFFSMLSPLIVLILYVLFLKKIQFDGLSEGLSGLGVSKDLISSFLDSWLVSGMLSIGCITVSLGANTIGIRDRETGVFNDMMVSPVKEYLVKISYYLFNALVTIFIMTIVFFVSLIYLGAVGAWYMTAGQVFALYGTLLYSSICATIFTSFVTGFCKSQAVHSAIVGIVSAMIGFVMGAYMPLDIMPTWVQYTAAILPGTHSAGMMREFLMTGALDAIDAVAMYPGIADSIAESYSMKINFFGKYIESGYMALYMLGATILLFIVNLFLTDRKPLGYKRSKKRKQ